METQEIVLWSVLTVAVAGAIAAIAGALRRRPRLSKAKDDVTEGPGAVSVTLDITAVDASDERLARIMREASARIFAAMPSVERVELLDRTGLSLGVHRRQRARDISPPLDVPESHAALRRDVPLWMAPVAEGEPLVADESFRASHQRSPEPDAAFVETPRRHMPLAERIDLPDAVRAVMSPAPDAVEVVRAILEVAGHSPIVEGDLVRVGDRAVIVLADPETSHEALNHAYFRFKASGAKEGLVVAPGPLDPADAKRRELLQPALTHVGALGVQRMADAVALGADPLKFARAPAMEIHPG